MLTLERKKKEHCKVDSEEKYDNVDDVNENDAASNHDSKGSMDPDRISNISNELTCILKELEAFGSDAATPSVPRKVDKAGGSDGHTNNGHCTSPVWQKRRPVHEKQNNVEMSDIRFGTGQRQRTNWYGEMKDSGDGLHTYPGDLYTSV